MSERFDLVVLGGGAAGLLASLTAAGVGARVALVEARAQPGAIAFFTGCVPSKSLIASANLAHALRTADRLGLEPSESEVDFARVMERVSAVIGEVGRHDRPEELEVRGVTVIRGRGRFLAPGVVAVGERRVGYRAAVVATGSLPLIPDTAGLDGPWTDQHVRLQRRRLRARHAGVLTAGDPVRRRGDCLRRRPHGRPRRTVRGRSQRHRRQRDCRTDRHGRRPPAGRDRR